MDDEIWSCRLRIAIYGVCPAATGQQAGVPDRILRGKRRDATSLPAAQCDDDGDGHADAERNPRAVVVHVDESVSPRTDSAGNYRPRLHTVGPRGSRFNAPLNESEYERIFASRNSGFPSGAFSLM